MQLWGEDKLFAYWEWTSLVAQAVRICLQCRGPGFDPWFRKIPWRRKRQPTPVFLPEKFHGQRYSPWGCKESHTTWAPKSLQMVTATMKLKDACFLEEKLWPNLDSILKSRDITLSTNVHLVKAMVFSNSHVWMWELDYKESESEIAQLCLTLCDLWTLAHQTPPSMGFSRQEYWPGESWVLKIDAFELWTFEVFLNLNFWSILQVYVNHLVKSMIFPVVMYACESWTVKKAEC